MTYNFKAGSVIVHSQGKASHPNTSVITELCGLVFIIVWRSAGVNTAGSELPSSFIGNIVGSGISSIEIPFPVRTYYE